ncbi:cytochrome P450 89A2-like [Macadamia integrifolia]|uniref:cytochrome P450 89A2-like n=1 Tax=Macadamia integrifolia TaxID=60698 RepID=UPI001C4FE4D2|nr:cytochrome P450 89A2-like [Macadamia integrifolia]
MEVWHILLPLFLGAALKFFFFDDKKKAKKTSKLPLPPGPPSRLPFLGNIFLFRKILSDIQSTVYQQLRDKYGPIISISVASNTTVVFISSHSLAHQALVKNSETFAHRPGPVTPSRVLFNNHDDVGSSSGALWRLLRRNITSEVLNPARYKSFGEARRWVLQILTQQFKDHSESGKPVTVIDHIGYAMFALMLFLCFGEKLDEKLVREIEDLERTLMSNYVSFNYFLFFPRLGKFIFRKSWLKLLDVRRRQESILIPPIKARREWRKKIKQEGQEGSNPDDGHIFSYIDSLFDLKIKGEEGERNLSDKEIMTLVSEFLDAGTDAPSSVLQWIMAHLVKDQDIQEKLYSEIKGVVHSKEEIKEEDLQKMPYLKAVVMEALRLHPPGHFVLHHTVVEDFELDGYLIPKNSIVNFMVAQMGRDPKVWEDPMEFKPERFLGDVGEVIDITGSREIKMMPFSAGRRICPGLGLATLHLEYFVANFVKDFKWTVGDGEKIDFSEKEEFTVMMKSPLRAHVSPRVK